MKIICAIFIILNAYTVISGKVDQKSLHIMDELDRKWLEYKKSHNKNYNAEFMESQRKKAWEDNYNRIERHNAEAAKGLHSYTLRQNCMADLSLRQYMRRMLKLIKNKKIHLAQDKDMVGAPHYDPDDVPEELDWRDKGFITPPYNQKSCGSCYAFSVAHSIQGQIFKQTGKLISLSEQQLVDCSTTTGNYGCGGGSLRNTLRYLEKSGGLMKESDYPYTAKQNKCQFVDELAIVNISSWSILPARDEMAIKVCVATIGPLAVSINASPHTFQLYSDGIYDDPGCASDSVNHAMLVVGYTKDYWILKNWWGEKWGDGGYMKLKMNENRCGVSNYAAYSIV